MNAAFRNVDHARERCRKSVPAVLFDFIDGGADDELTIAANREAFRRVTFRPRSAVPVPQPDLSTTVLGHTLALPVVIAPCGGVRLVHRDGDRAVVRAAGQFGAAAIMSTALGTEVEDVIAESSAPAWFQLYFRGGRDGAEYLVDRVQNAGFTALFVTIDSSARGSDERLQRHGLPWPPTLTPSTVARLTPQLIVRPRWLAGYLLDGRPTTFAANRPDGAGEGEPTGFRPGSVPEIARPSPSWEDFTWIRSRWRGPLVVKGVLTAEDARRAVDVGADGVVVSNHGGRQMDGLPATLEVLPEILEAVGDRVDVLIDGGIRRGTDVVKALAIGASAAMIGRPYLYGLGAAGERGVVAVLDLFRRDLVRALRTLGCPSIAALDRSFVNLRRL
jgi:isopentenyl diphosphate isomerase/L-lactate dehydrogenase-like FMN-dependent dehydrogenase